MQKINMLNQNTKKYLFFLNWNAENWGGAFSLMGSLLAACAVDWQSAVATSIFLTASAVFNYKGEDYRYYSLGYTLVAIGDIALSFSVITDQNEAAKISLYWFSFLALLGGMRYPLTKFIEKSNKTNQLLSIKTEKVLNHLPATVGVLNVVFKIPAMWVSIFSGEHENLLMAVCYSLWLIADFLLSGMWKII